MSEVSRLDSAAAFHAASGSARFVSEWFEIDQDRVQRFADVTDDHQWIHVDPKRAALESPFGGAIAHGFLTLSLLPMWLEQCVPLVQRMSVNYGLNRVRFVTPVLVGSRLRGIFNVGEVSDVGDGGVQVSWHITIEIDGSERPAGVVEFVTRHYF